MRVPTTDYSPIINAVRANTQAQQTQFIAPQIDYARKSSKNQNRMLILQSKGLELQQVSNIVNTGFSIVNSGIDLMQNMYQDQKFQANKTLQQNAKETSSAILSGLANQSIWVDEQGNVNGMDTLNSLKESQLAAVEDKKWFKSVKREYSEGLDSIYADSQRAILDQANRNAIESNFQHQQDLIGQYAKIDAGRLNAKEGEEYKLTYGYIDSLPRTAAEKQQLKFEAANDINWMKAQNSVSAIANRTGDYDTAKKEADRWADEYDMSYEQRDALYGIAKKVTNEATSQATSMGFEYMSKGLQNNQTPVEIRQQAENDIEGASQSKKNAVIAGMDRAQLNHCADFISRVTGNVETPTSADIATMRENITNNKAMFEGCDAAKELYQKTLDALDKEEALQVQADFNEKFTPMAQNILPGVINRTMTPKKALELIGTAMKEANGDANTIAACEKLTDMVINETNKMADPAIKQTREAIKNSYIGMYGKDFLTKPGEVYDRIRVAYQQNLVDADAKIMDLCLNNGEMTSAQVEAEAQKIRDNFINKNALIFSEINKALPKDEKFTNSYISYTADDLNNAIKTEKDEAKKNALRDVKDNLSGIEDIIDNLPLSERQPFAKKIRDEVLPEFKSDPKKWLDKFENTKKSDDKAWINNPGQDYTIEISGQNKKFYDPELMEIYPLIAGTQEGRDFAANRQILDRAMITAIMVDVGRPVNPNGWQEYDPIYRPDFDGWVYMNGDDIFRVVKSGDGFKVERLWDGGYNPDDRGNEGTERWVSVTPNREPYSNETIEGTANIIKKNNEIIESQKGNATRYWNAKTRQWQDNPPEDNYTWLREF